MRESKQPKEEEDIGNDVPLEHRENGETIYTQMFTEDNCLERQEDDSKNLFRDRNTNIPRLKVEDDYQNALNPGKKRTIAGGLTEESDLCSSSVKRFTKPHSFKEDDEEVIMQSPKESQKASGSILQFSSEFKDDNSKKLNGNDAMKKNQSKKDSGSKQSNQLQRSLTPTCENNTNEQAMTAATEMRTKSGKLKIRLVKTTVEQEMEKEENIKLFARKACQSLKPTIQVDDKHSNSQDDKHDNDVHDDWDSSAIERNNQKYNQNPKLISASQKKRLFFRMSAGVSRLRSLFSKSITDRGSGIIVVLLNAWRFASNLKKRSMIWNQNTMNILQTDLINDVASLNQQDTNGKRKKMRQSMAAGSNSYSNLNSSQWQMNSYNNNKDSLLRQISNGNGSSSIIWDRCENPILRWIISILESVPIINPQSQYLYAWDTIHSLFIVLTILVKPIELVTMKHMTDEYTSIIWHIFPMICLFVFCLDIIFNFNTGFYQCGMCIMERNQVMYNYMRKGVLWDLLAILPILDSVFMIQGGWRIVNVFILFKYATMRGIMAKYLELFQLQNEVVISTFIKLMKVGTLVLFQAHLFACLFLGLAVLEDNYKFVDLNWIVRYSKIQQTAQNDNQWLEYGSVFSQYIYSFYWSVTTMTTTGYGDILPANNYEAIFTAFSMIIAGGVFAYSFNSIGIIVQEMDKRNQEFQHDLRLISKYLQNNNIKKSLQMEVTKYIEYKHRAEKELSTKEEKEVLEKLGPNIRAKVTTSANIQLIKLVPFLANNFSKRFLRRLALCLQKQTYLNNEIIFEGDDFYSQNYFQQPTQPGGIAVQNIYQQQQQVGVQQQQQQQQQQQFYQPGNSPLPVMFPSPMKLTNNNTVNLSGSQQVQISGQFPQYHPSGFSGYLNPKRLSQSSQQIQFPQLNSQGNTTNHRQVSQKQQLVSTEIPQVSVVPGGIGQGFEGYTQQQQQQQLFPQRLNTIMSLVAPNNNSQPTYHNSNTNPSSYFQQLQCCEDYQQLNLQSSNSLHSETAFYIVERGQIQLFTQSQKQASNDYVKPIKDLKKADSFGELSFFSDKPRCASARSIGASSVLSIRKKDFIKILKEFPLDYEIFCQIRDEISLNDDLSSLQIHCYACGAIGHTSFECFKIHYKPDAESVILKHKYQQHESQFKRDTNFWRKNDSKYNCLAKYRDIKECQERLCQQIMLQNQSGVGGEGSNNSQGLLLLPPRQDSQIIMNKLPTLTQRQFSQDQVLKKGLTLLNLKKLSTEQLSFEESKDKEFKKPKQYYKQPVSLTNIHNLKSHHLLVEGQMFSDEKISNRQNQGNPTMNLTPRRFKKENTILEEVETPNERDNYYSKFNNNIKEDYQFKDQQTLEINQLAQGTRPYSSMQQIDRVPSIAVYSDNDEEDKPTRMIKSSHKRGSSVASVIQRKKQSSSKNSRQFIEDIGKQGSNQYKVCLEELKALPGENLNESGLESIGSSCASSRSNNSKDKKMILKDQEKQQSKQRLGFFPSSSKTNVNIELSERNISVPHTSHRLEELKAIKRSLQHQSSLFDRNIQKNLLLQHIQETLKDLENLEEERIVSNNADCKDDGDGDIICNNNSNMNYEGQDLANNNNNTNNKLRFPGIQRRNNDNINIITKNPKQGNSIIDLDMINNHSYFSKKELIIEFPSMNTDRMKNFKQYFPLNNCENVLKSLSQLKPHYFNRRNRTYHIYNRDTIKAMYAGVTGIDSQNYQRNQRLSRRLTKIASAVINSNNTKKDKKSIGKNKGKMMQDKENASSSGINKVKKTVIEIPKQKNVSFFLKSPIKVRQATFSSDESI